MFKHILKFGGSAGRPASQPAFFSKKKSNKKIYVSSKKYSDLDPADLLILLTLPVLLRKQEDPLDRLKRGQGPAGDQTEGGKSKSLRQASDGGEKLDKYAGFLEPKDDKEYGAVRLK